MLPKFIEINSIALLKEDQKYFIKCKHSGWMTGYFRLIKDDNKINWEIWCFYPVDNRSFCCLADICEIYEMEEK